MTKTPTIEELLVPPDDAAVARALDAFATSVRAHYGVRLRGLYLFGSRARGDHTPDSDADVAVVLGDDGWGYWDEKTVLADIAYSVLIETGAEIQGRPVTERAWQNPESHRNPSLVRAMQRDAKVLRWQ
jgi:antitoxin ChpS